MALRCQPACCPAVLLAATPALAARFPMPPRSRRGAGQCIRAGGGSGGRHRQQRQILDCAAQGKPPSLSCQPIGWVQQVVAGAVPVASLSPSARLPWAACGFVGWMWWDKCPSIEHAWLQDRDIDEDSDVYKEIQKARDDLAQVRCGPITAWRSMRGTASWVRGDRQRGWAAREGDETEGVCYSCGAGYPCNGAVSLQARSAHADDKGSPVHPLRLVHDIQVGGGSQKLSQCHAVLACAPLKAGWLMSTVRGQLVWTADLCSRSAALSRPDLLPCSRCWTGGTATSTPYIWTWAATTSTTPATCKCTTRARRARGCCPAGWLARS